MPATVEKHLLGPQTPLLTTALNALANNALATPVVFDNTIGAAGDGCTFCDLELAVTFGTAPTAGTGVAVWFLGTQDGTNYEDGSSTVTPARAPDAVLPVLAVTTAQRVLRRCLLPWGLLKVLIKNDGTGQAFSASGHALKIRPVAREMV